MLNDQVKGCECHNQREQKEIRRVHNAKMVAVAKGKKKKFNGWTTKMYDKIHSLEHKISAKDVSTVAFITVSDLIAEGMFFVSKSYVVTFYVVSLSLSL